MSFFKEILHRILLDIKPNRAFLIIITSYAAAAQLIFHTVCPFAIFTGRPCPACGMTRASLLLFSGRFAAAAGMNPAVFLWVPLLIYLCFFRYVLGKKAPLASFFLISAGIFTIICYLFRFAADAPVSVPQPGILPRLLHIS